MQNERQLSNTTLLTHSNPEYYGLADFQQNYSRRKSELIWTGWFLQLKSRDEHETIYRMRK